MAEFWEMGWEPALSDNYLMYTVLIKFKIRHKPCQRDQSLNVRVIGNYFVRFVWIYGFQ